MENRKAEVEMSKARITGLARQSCVGLEKVYGLKVDYTTFAARLTDAFKIKERMKAAAFMGEGGAEEKSDSASQNELLLIDAVMRYGASRCALL